ARWRGQIGKRWIIEIVDQIMRDPRVIGLILQDGVEDRAGALFTREIQVVVERSRRNLGKRVEDSSLVVGGVTLVQLCHGRVVRKSPSLVVDLVRISKIDRDG